MPQTEKKDLHDMCRELLQTWDTYHTQWTIPWTHETAIQDLQYQIGSVAKISLQLRKYRYADGLSESELMNKMSDELADILAEVIFVADGFGIDLTKAWNNMLESDKKKIRIRSSIKK